MGFCDVRFNQAINNLAENDNNKVLIVQAGTLPYYVKLLDPAREEDVKLHAAQGLWMLAFKCKDRVAREPGCLQGWCYFIKPRYNGDILLQ